MCYNKANYKPGGGIYLRDAPYRRSKGLKGRISRESSSGISREPYVKKYEEPLKNIPQIEKANVKPAGVRAYAAPTRKVDRYDFTKVEKLALDQERYLEKVLIHFAELLTALLVSILRLRIQIKWENNDYVSYDVYTHSLVDPSALNVFNIEGVNARGIIFLEFPLCLTIIDRLLGGKGQPVSEDNRLTELEEVIFCRLIQKVLGQFSEAFKEIKEFTVKNEKMECNPQAVQLYSPSEPMAIANFRIRIGDMPGDMKICLPLQFLKPVIPKVKPSELLPRTTVNSKGQKITTNPIILESARIGIVVELGRSDIMFQDLVNIGVGDVVRLNMSIENPLRVKIEGKTKFLGRPGVREKKVALQICKVVQEGDEEFEEQ